MFYGPNVALEALAGLEAWGNQPLLCPRAVGTQHRSLGGWAEGGGKNDTCCLNGQITSLPLSEPQFPYPQEEGVGVRCSLSKTESKDGPVAKGGGPASIPGRGTRSHMLKLGV